MSRGIWFELAMELCSEEKFYRWPVSRPPKPDPCTATFPDCCLPWALWCGLWSTRTRVVQKLFFRFAQGLAGKSMMVEFNVVPLFVIFVPWKGISIPTLKATCALEMMTLPPCWIRLKPLEISLVEPVLPMQQCRRMISPSMAPCFRSHFFALPTVWILGTLHCLHAHKMAKVWQAVQELLIRPNPWSVQISLGVKTLLLTWALFRRLCCIAVLEAFGAVPKQHS